MLLLYCKSDGHANIAISTTTSTQIREGSKVEQNKCNASNYNFPGKM